MIASTSLVVRLKRLKKAKGRPEFQRIQCVLIRATLGSSAAEIARLPGWSTPTVHVIHFRWAKEGDAIFNLKAKGGRRNEYLTREEEAAFLRPFLDKAEAGGVLNANDIKEAFERLVGYPVAKSTIYRLLARHDWRQVVPRPRQPKGDPAAQAASRKPETEVREEVERQARVGAPGSPDVPGRGALRPPWRSETLLGSEGCATRGREPPRTPMHLCPFGRQPP